MYFEKKETEIQKSNLVSICNFQILIVTLIFSIFGTIFFVSKAFGETHDSLKKSTSDISSKDKIEQIKSIIERAQNKKEVLIWRINAVRLMGIDALRRFQVYSNTPCGAEAYDFFILKSADSKFRIRKNCEKECLFYEGVFVGQLPESICDALYNGGTPYHVYSGF